MRSLARDDMGRLYGVDTFYDRLLDFDPVTGEGLAVGRLHPNDNYDNVRSLAYDRGSGVLYGVNATAGADQLLVTARAGEGGEVGLFLVEDASAARRRPVLLVDGTAGAELNFDATPATLLRADALPLLEEVVDEAIVALGAQARTPPPSRKTTLDVEPS